MPELATKADLLAMEQELRATIQELRASIGGSREFRAGFSDLNAHLEIQILRLTIRFGVMWALAIWFLLIIVKLK